MKKAETLLRLLDTISWHLVQSIGGPCGKEVRRDAND